MTDAASGTARTMTWRDAARETVPWFAGGCVGLFLGAAALGTWFGMNEEVIRAEHIARYTLIYLLAGFAFLLPVTAVFAVPLVRRLRARPRSIGAVVVGALGATVAVGVIVGLVVGIVSGILTGTWGFASSVSVTVVAGLWCLTPALILLPWLGGHRRVALGVVAVTAALALSGAVAFLA